MTDPCSLGPWLRRFLEEHLVSERNLARNTQLSYRDTLALLLDGAPESGVGMQSGSRAASADHLHAQIALAVRVRGA